MNIIEITVKITPMQDIRRLAKKPPLLCMRCKKSCGLPTLQYISMGWVAIQHPVINFDMLLFTGFYIFKTIRMYTVMIIHPLFLPNRRPPYIYRFVTSLDKQIPTIVQHDLRNPSYLELPTDIRSFIRIFFFKVQ